MDLPKKIRVFNLEGGDTKMDQIIKPIGVTIDKLTVLADLEIDHDEFLKMIARVGFEIQDYQSKKYGYSSVYVHKESGGYIELARQKIDYDVQDLERKKYKLWGLIKGIKQGNVNTTGETLAELNERLEEIQEVLEQVDERGHLKRLKDVRYELNPKYFYYSKTAEYAFRKVMSALNQKTLSMSSIHIALDYPVSINSIEITDIKSRKQNIFIGKNKRVETMYFGKRSSRNHICVYDKKLEVEENDGIDQYPDYPHITRFEARLKSDYAKKFFTSEFNPFGGLIISDDFESAVFADKGLTDAEAGRIILYFKQPGRLHSLPATTRKRYQRKMKKYTGLYLNVAGDYEEEKDSLVEELESWFKPLSKESIPENENK